MKRINKKILQLRIRLLQKLLAAIGITAIISSCQTKTEPQNESNADSTKTEIVQQDTITEKIVPVDTPQTKPNNPQKPPQNNPPQTLPEMNKPDRPVTKYGVPVFDKNENIQVKYGAPNTTKEHFN